MRSDLAGGAAVFDPFGEAVAEATQTKVLALKDDIISGSKNIWEGPILSQDGTEVAAAGVALDMDAVETMDFLVKGVVGSTN